ncbi:hypothetical protein FSP39_021773 [Pinctada imbricata]|uniref:Uncharacterized protein n=1 Tax=Pinctada imbricata TaxID=66713 RepID=A0AA89C4X6_PINIB|nr:hypothetical protein FSP39_021773 [Pinctada imbricata]
MQVNINGPETTSNAAETIVKQTIKQWYEPKQRRKLPKCEDKPKEGEVPMFTVKQRDVSTQADIGVPEQDVQEKVQEVLKLLNIRSKELVSESSESEESEEDEADYEIEKELEFEHFRM